jgi:hypothetical protein
MSFALRQTSRPRQREASGPLSWSLPTIRKSRRNHTGEAGAYLPYVDCVIAVVAEA